MRRQNSLGFSLVEILVVIGITGILLALVLVPMQAGLSFLNIGRASITAQDTARQALAQMTREMSDALSVFQTTVSEVDTRLDTTRVHLKMPKNTLSDLWQDRKIVHPLVPERRIVTYFIGLQNVGKWNGTDDWRYANKYLTQFDGIAQPDNVYWLFRAEYDPYDPNDPGYDPSTQGGGYERWREQAFLDDPVIRDRLKSAGRLTALVPLRDVDMVDPRAVDANGFVDPVKAGGLRIEPVFVKTEIPVPLDGRQSYSPGSNDIPSIFRSRLAHWGGYQNDGSIWFDPSDLNLVSLNPVIRIWNYDEDPGNPLVFDSSAAQDPNRRRREVAWDSSRGQLIFARPVEWKSDITSDNVFIPNNNPADPYYYLRISLLQTPSEQNLGFRLVRDSLRAELHSPGSGGEGETVELQLVDDVNPDPNENQIRLLEDRSSGNTNIQYVVKIHKDLVKAFRRRSPSGLAEMRFRMLRQCNRYGRDADYITVQYNSYAEMTVTLKVYAYRTGTDQPQLMQLTSKVRSRNM